MDTKTLRAKISELKQQKAIEFYKAHSSDDKENPSRWDAYGAIAEELQRLQAMLDQRESPVTLFRA